MTVFFRVLEETKDKEKALINLIRGKISCNYSKYSIDPEEFKRLPGKPFAYWVGESIRALFERNEFLGDGNRTARVGLQTGDDFRFIRLWWEPNEAAVNKKWTPLAKGGKYRPYYDDLYLLVNWEHCGKEIEGHSGSVVRNQDYYFQYGLTWPMSTKSEFSIRPLNKNSIFGVKGPAFFVKDNCEKSLLAIMAILNSSIFSYLLKIYMAAADGSKGGAARSYLVGAVLQIPFLSIDAETKDKLAGLSLKAWSNRITLNSFNEADHKFKYPALLAFDGEDLESRYLMWVEFLKRIESDFNDIIKDINEKTYLAYKLTSSDKKVIWDKYKKEKFDNSAADCEDKRDGEDDENDSAADNGVSGCLNGISIKGFASSFISWIFGFLAGRFSVSFFFNEKLIEQDDNPFSNIPSQSLGMKCSAIGEPTIEYQSLLNLVSDNEFLIDDFVGNPLDIVEKFKKAFKYIFPINHDGFWAKICQNLDLRDGSIRSWLRNEFFIFHENGYRGGKRRSPIYWPISTAGKGFNVWIYSHRANSDSLFRLAELISLRKKEADFELARLDPLGDTEQRRVRFDLELLVVELKDLHEEVERVQSIFHPNLDDGTVLVLAPLHRLFKAYPAWQQELADRWKDLVRGEYDWSSQAMRLWPERVVRKCQKDRSLAIAHGLDEFFWEPGPSEKAVARPVSEDDIQKVIAEHTKPPIQNALRSLIDAPPQTRGGARRPAPARASRDSAARLSTPKKASVEKRRSSSADLQDLSRQVLAFLQAQSGQVGKREILEGAGVSANQWSRVIDALIEQGLVEKVGEKRGAGYRVTDNSDAGGPS